MLEEAMFSVPWRLVMQLRRYILPLLGAGYVAAVMLCCMVTCGAVLLVFGVAVGLYWLRGQLMPGHEAVERFMDRHHAHSKE